MKTKLSLLTLALSLAGLFHGPTLPPDPWNVRTSHGPTLPPDPWNLRVAQ